MKKPRHIPQPSMWALIVWRDEWKTIAEAEQLAATRRSWQPGRLASLVGVTELAAVLGCGRPHACDLRKGRRQINPEQIPKIVAHVEKKIADHYARTAAAASPTT